MFEKCKPVQFLLARGKETLSKSPLSSSCMRDLHVHAKYTHIVSSRTKKITKKETVR